MSVAKRISEAYETTGNERKAREFAAAECSGTIPAGTVVLVRRVDRKEFWRLHTTRKAVTFQGIHSVKWNGDRRRVRVLHEGWLISF